MNDFLRHSSGVNEEEGRRALAAAVVHDRTRIHRTIERAKAYAGISRGAWEKVERAARVRPYTLAAVEQALDWPPGRAQQIIDRGDQGQAEDGSDPVESAVLRSTLNEDRQDAVLIFYRRQLRDQQREDRLSG